jgi:hypothetical protein
MNNGLTRGLMAALLLAGIGCGDEEPVGDGAEQPDASSGGTGGSAGGDGSAGSGGPSHDGGDAADSAQDGESDGADGGEGRFLGRFANFDSRLPAFDVCMSLNPAPGAVFVRPGLPLFAEHGIAPENVALDRVSARVSVPLSAVELFLVPADTTACETATPLSIGPFAPFFPAGERSGFQAGDRFTFMAADPVFSSIGRTSGEETGEFRSCPAGSVCILFAAFSSYEPFPETPPQGPVVTLYLVLDGTRNPVSWMGLTSFNFNDVILPELPLSGATSVELAIREQGGTADLISIELPQASGKIFSVWYVGHAGGADSPRVVLCRDSDAESGGLSPCTRIPIP